MQLILAVIAKCDRLSGTTLALLTFEHLLDMNPAYREKVCWKIAFSYCIMKFLCVLAAVIQHS